MIGIARCAFVLTATITSLSQAAPPSTLTVLIAHRDEAPSALITGTSQIDSTCLPYTPGVLLLEAWGTPASSFCTSWEPITTVVVTTTTSTTSTIVAPTSTVTASTVRTVYTFASPRTVYSPTVTVTGPATTSFTGSIRQCTGAQKRDLTVTVPVPASLSTDPVLPTDPSPSTVALPANAPAALSTFPSSYVASACECLHLPTPTSTTTITVTERSTTTPISTYTPTTTSTITGTVTRTTTVTVPGGVVFAHPTPLTNVNSSGYSNVNYGSDWFDVGLPFPVHLYGQNGSDILVNADGWLTISGDPNNNDVNGPLPSDELPKVAFVANWSDLYIYQRTKQALYYQVYGSPGSFTAVFEWYTGVWGTSHGYYHFTASFNENNPGSVIYDYYEVTAQIPVGLTAYGTVGVQSLKTNQYAQYSFNNTPPINSNMRVIYSPGSDSFSVQSCQ